MRSAPPDKGGGLNAVMRRLAAWRFGGNARVSPWPLAALAVVVMLLSASGVVPAWPGLLHLVALPPFDQLADLRLLVTLSPSYPVFVLGLVASLAVRVTVMALLLGGLSKERLLFALRVYLLALPFTLVAASFLWASPAVLFYGLFWFGLQAGVFALLLLGALPWVGKERLLNSIGASAKQGLRAGTLLAYLGLLFLLGLVADFAGPVGVVLLVPVSGALTLLAVVVLLNPSALRLPRRILGALTTAAIAGGFFVVFTGPPAPPEGAPLAQPRSGSLMLMSGVDSASGSGAVLEIDPRTLGFTCEQTFYYSYAGPGDGQPQGDAQCPIVTGAPYVEEDTLRPTEELIQFLFQQIAELPEPITLLTHSQGVWVVWEALARHGANGVENVVLIGPFPENLVSYPPDREVRPGRVGTDILLLLAELPRPTGTTAFDPGEPLAREFLAPPGAISRTLSRPLPAEVRVLSVPSIFDLPIMPREWRVPGVPNVCPVPVTHPNLPYAEELHQAVNDFLDDRVDLSCSPWRVVVGPLTRHFAVPQARHLHEDWSNSAGDRAHGSGAHGYAPLRSGTVP